MILSRVSAYVLFNRTSVLIGLKYMKTLFSFFISLSRLTVYLNIERDSKVRMYFDVRKRERERREERKKKERKKKRRGKYYLSRKKRREEKERETKREKREKEKKRK